MMYFGIVIYNKECSKSSSIKKLLSITNNIIVVDNSEIKTNNYNFCKSKNIKYINMNGNYGLSKAYNKILDILNDKEGYIMWLDDDTDIDLDYIKNVIDDNYNYDVYIPIVRSNEKIISPLRKIGVRYRGINHIINNIYAINTCLIVNLDIYKNFRYDDNLFLDNVDLSFFKYINSINIKLKVIDTNIKQDFFFINNKDLDKFKKRITIFIKDNIYYYNRFIDKFLFMLRVLYMGIKYSIKYKNIKVILFIYKEYLKTIIKNKKK